MQKSVFKFIHNSRLLPNVDNKRRQAGSKFLTRCSDTKMSVDGRQTELIMNFANVVLQFSHSTS